MDPITEMINKRAVVISPGYLKWIYKWDYNAHGIISDDGNVKYLDNTTLIDVDNAAIISYLFAFLREKEPFDEDYGFTDPKSNFSNIIYFMKIGRKFFFIQTIFGQGTTTFIGPYEGNTYHGHAYDFDLEAWVKF